MKVQTWYSMRVARPTDLSKASDEDLYAEIGRRRQAARTTFAGGPAATCDCGQCLKCRRREAMRRYRAKAAKAGKK